MNLPDDIKKRLEIRAADLELSDKEETVLIEAVSSLPNPGSVINDILFLNKENLIDTVIVPYAKLKAIRLK